MNLLGCISPTVVRRLSLPACHKVSCRHKKLSLLLLPTVGQRREKAVVWFKFLLMCVATRMEVYMYESHYPDITEGDS